MIEQYTSLLLKTLYSFSFRHVMKDYTANNLLFVFSYELSIYIYAHIYSIHIYIYIYISNFIK